MRKILSVLVALVMLLTPVLGMAASPAGMLDAAWQAGATVSTKVSFAMADLPLPEETKTVVNDLVNALGFRTAANIDGKAEAALTLQGQDALTVGIEPVGDELYINLPLVTARTMAFNGEEFLTVLERLVLLAAEASGASQSDLEQVQALFDGGFMLAAETAMASVEAMEFQMPEIDLDAILQMLMNGATMTESPVQPADCDPVASGVTLYITPEVVQALVQIFCDVLEANPGLVDALKQADMDIDPESLKEAPAAAAEEFKAEYGVVPLTILMDAAGNVPYVDMVFTPVNGGVTSAASYARQTLDNGVAHALSFTDDGEGACFLLVDSCAENKTEYGFALYEVISGRRQGVLLDSGFLQTRDRNELKAHDVTTLFAIIPTGDSAPASVTVTLTIDQQAETTAEGAKCDTVASLGCDLLDGDFFTVHVNTVADGAPMASIAGEDALRPGAMTEEEFAGFVEAVPNNALTAVFSAMQMLPVSVLMLLMTQ